MNRVLVLLGLLMSILSNAYASGHGPSEALDALHRAGKAADFAAFNALLNDDAVILGHNGTGRLAGEGIREHLEAMLVVDSAWPYRADQRNIRYSADGGTAWFDEALNHDTLGSGWGSGVLVKTSDGWKLAQYSFFVPTNGQGQSGASAAMPVEATSIVTTDSAATGSATTDSATTPSTDAVAEEPPEKKKECRRMRHKTNKMSRC